MTNPAEPEKPLGAKAAEAWAAETRNRFRQARLWAAHAAPYLTSALFALQPVILEPNISEPQPDTQADRPGDVRQPVPDPEFRAFPADTHWRIHIDPGMALATPTPEFGWWLLHHIGHLCRHHAARSPVTHDHDADQSRHAVGEQTDDLAARRWNQAADAEVNDDLETLGLASPPGVVSPQALGLPEGRLAEEYLSLIEVLDEAHLAGGSHVADLIDCGQAADGITDDGLDTSSVDDGTHPMSDVARNLLELRIAHDIEQQVANRTAVPGGWRRWAQQQLRPTIDWRATLRATIRQGLRVGAGQVDYSYRRPSRRPAPDGVILPTMVAPKPEIAVVVDTSGSVSGQQLNTVMTELIGITQHANLRQIRVICCDLVAHPPQTIRAGHMPLLTGGGGTDIRAGITAASKLKPQPTLIIVLTDGETPWPDRRPPIPVIIAVIRTPRRDPTGTYPIPWWARTVNIDE